MRDKNGDPIRIGSFVKVSRTGSVGPVKFKGQVVRFDTKLDEQPLVVVREWKTRGFGNERLALPAQCETRRKPAALKEHESAIVGAKLRGRRA